MTGTFAAAVLLAGAGYWLVRWLRDMWREHRRWLSMPVLSEEDCLERCYRARPGRPMVELVEREEERRIVPLRSGYGDWVPSPDR